MRLSDIEASANRGNLANGDFDTGMILRRVVVQDYLNAIGDVRWRHVFGTISVTPGTRVYNMPDDYFKMVEIYCPYQGAIPNSQPGTLKYIGEDPLLVAQAEMATVPGSPGTYYANGGWYNVRRLSVIADPSSDLVWKAIKLAFIPDSAITLPYEYLTYPYFADNTTDVGMDPYIPEPLQAGLIHGLRSLIIEDRFGQGDQRAVLEQQRFQDWIEKAKNHRDLARRNFASFVN